MAILAVVGTAWRSIRRWPRACSAPARFPLRMVSQAASRRNVTIVLPQSYLFAAMSHLHRSSSPSRSLRHDGTERRLLLVGHGRMGGWSSRWRRSTGSACRSGHVGERQCVRLAGADVAIDFSAGGRPRNADRLASRGTRS
jgi:hypothetical protein